MTNYEQLSQSPGYQALKSVVNRLKGETNPYALKTNDELHQLHTTASAWLNENMMHEKYEEALKRFEQLEEEINKRQVKEFLL